MLCNNDSEVHGQPTNVVHKLCKVQGESLNNNKKVRVKNWNAQS